VSISSISSTLLLSVHIVHTAPLYADTLKKFRFFHTCLCHHQFFFCLSATYNGFNPVFLMEKYRLMCYGKLKILNDLAMYPGQTV